MDIGGSNLEQLSKEMIQYCSPALLDKHHKADIFMSSPPLQKPLQNVGEFILQTHETPEDLRTFDHQTLDAKTVISNDFSQNSGDKSIKFGKVKPAPRKSAYSMPGKGVKNNTNIFSIPEVASPVVQPPVINADKSDDSNKAQISLGKVAAKKYEGYTHVNDVYDPSFSFERFKSLIFSRPIKHKEGFQKFLLEIKADIEMIKLISMKEPCPPKVPLLKLDKSSLRSYSAKRILFLDLDETLIHTDFKDGENKPVSSKLPSPL